MSTFTFFTDLEAAEKFAAEQQAEHGHVNGISASTYGYGSNAMEGYRVEMFRGMVVGEREANGYHDSDFFAIWYDAEKDEHGEFMFGTTRGWTYANGCRVDASQEVRDAYAANRQRAAEKGRKWREEKEAAARAKAPVKGATVRVKSKRSKVPHGTEGVVFWFGESSYTNPYRGKYRNPYADLIATRTEQLLGDLGSYRVGIMDADGQKHFLAATAVEVLVPAPAEAFAY
jgi:hypothetical protein